MDICRTHIFLDAFNPFRARYRDYVFPLGHQPGQRQLPGGSPPAGSQFGDLIDQLQIFGEIHSLEPWGLASVVIGVEIIKLFENSFFSCIMNS